VNDNSSIMAKSRMIQSGPTAEPTQTTIEWVNSRLKHHVAADENELFYGVRFPNAIEVDSRVIDGLAVQLSPSNYASVLMGGRVGIDPDLFVGFERRASDSHNTLWNAITRPRRAVNHHG
jgi:hypothetical protein